MGTNLISVKQNDITLARGSLANHPATRYLAGLSVGARRPQLQALNVITSILTSGALNDCMALDWGQVKYAHAAAVRSTLAERYKPATANRMLAAFRGVMHAARFLGLLSVDEWQTITAPKIGALKVVKGQTLPAGRALAAGEIRALSDDCKADKAAAGARDGALIGLAYGCGLRRAEIVNLDLADYDPATHGLKFTGKGKKERTSYVKNGALAALEDWLQLRGAQPGPLFLAVGKGGKIRANDRLSTQSVYNMMQRRAVAAGLAHFSPHDMRHTFISDLLDAGADISTVAQLVGHANVQTTMRYDRRPEEAKQKAAGLIHFPW